MCICALRTATAITPSTLYMRVYVCVCVSTRANSRIPCLVFDIKGNSPPQTWGHSGGGGGGIGVHKASVYFTI